MLEAMPPTDGGAPTPTDPEKAAMDQTVLLYLLLAFVIIAPIVWFFLRRRVLAKAASAGEDFGVGFEKRIVTGETTKLGTRVRFADAAAARRIVDEVFSTSKDVTVTGPATWDLRYAKPDDLHVTWTIGADGGGVLRVDRAREMIGQLVGGRVWIKLVTRITAASRAAGVAAATEVVPLVAGDVPAEGDRVWIAG